MNKKSNKLAVFLIALAAVIIVGVVVMLMLPTGEPAPTETPTVQSPSPSETSSPAPSAQEGKITQEATAEGTIYTVTVPDNSVTYSITASTAAVGFSGKADDLRLTSIAVSSDFINVTFNKGTDAKTLAPKIMDRYIKYNEFEQSGQDYIPGTEIAGETVTAGDGNAEVKAWLVDTDSGVLAVVLRYNVSDADNVTAQLYDTLKTLKIVN